jgi:general L-amino acid transport system substrate-binding protein
MSRFHVLRLASAAVIFAPLLITVPAHAAATLDKVKRNAAVTCGVSTGGTGFSIADSQGRWTGLDVDFCRQLAAAVLGDAAKVKYVPLSAQQRFTALQSGEIDVLARRATWTLQRDTELGLNFAPPNFYDGQGFIVAAKLGVKHAKELDGATICVGAGTTSELNLADYFRKNKISFKPVVIEAQNEVETAFFSGRCDAYSNDVSGLASTRAGRAANADDYVILPEVISKEPLAPAVRHGDDEWFDIVKWVQYAAIEAEEEGITSKNVDEKLKSEDPNVKRLLGVTPGMGKSLNLDEKWAYNLVKQVGNYGEVFERNVGKDSALKLERGLNDLWTKGGLMYAMPVR